MNAPRIAVVPRSSKFAPANLLPKNEQGCSFLSEDVSGFKQYRGCLKSWLLFRHPREFKIKSLCSNDLILNIANKLKETVQKLKFLDSSVV